MSPPLQQAIALNNKGVSFLASSDDDKALACFSRSLAIFRGIVCENDANKAKSECAPLQSYIHQDMVSLSPMPQTSFFLLNTAVTFRPTSSVHQAHTHIYCATIIFNLALLYHRQNSARSLNKAEKFYEMAGKILNGKISLAFPTGTDLVLQLAVVNNLSHIKLLRGDIADAEEGLQSLAYFVGGISQMPVENPSMFDGNELDAMLLNILMVNRQRTAAAA